MYDVFTGMLVYFVVLFRRRGKRESVGEADPDEARRAAGGGGGAE